jgi:hypothetical protein
MTISGILSVVVGKAPIEQQMARFADSDAAI